MKFKIEKFTIVEAAVHDNSSGVKAFFQNLFCRANVTTVPEYQFVVQLHFSGVPLDRSNIIVLPNGVRLLVTDVELNIARAITYRRIPDDLRAYQPDFALLSRHTKTDI